MRHWIVRPHLNRLAELIAGSQGIAFIQERTSQIQMGWIRRLHGNGPRPQSIRVMPDGDLFRAQVAPGEKKQDGGGSEHCYSSSGAI